MSQRVKEILMRRDDVTAEEADATIAAFKADFEKCLATGSIWAAEDLLSDHFGLEPDYLIDFL